MAKVTGGDATARCPICGDSLASEARPPFCSERCRLVDLSNWLGGTYRVSDEHVAVDRDTSGEGVELAASLASEHEENACD